MRSRDVRGPKSNQCFKLSRMSENTKPGATIVHIAFTFFAAIRQDHESLFVFFTVRSVKLFLKGYIENYCFLL